MCRNGVPPKNMSPTTERTILRGYTHIMVQGITSPLNRRIYFHHHPDTSEAMLIDHINRDKSDNRLCNLRAVTASENKCNTGPRPDNTSGERGASLNADGRRWNANIEVRQLHYTLGIYDTKKEAGLAYHYGARILHGRFGHHQTNKAYDDVDDATKQRVMAKVRAHIDKKDRKLQQRKVAEEAGEGCR